MPAPPPSAEPLLSIEDLTVSFDRPTGAASPAMTPATSPATVPAARDVRLDVHRGEMVALVGESGSGKSVTALSIVRLLPAPPARIDSGRIRFNGMDLLQITEQRMRRVRGRDIAMIFQEPMTALNPVLTIGEQIIETIQRSGDASTKKISTKRARDEAIEAMRDVGIDRPEQRMRSYPHEFSGGMCQRVMIAMALVCRPRLLIADEPTTALDVTIQKQILDLLRDLQRQRHLSILLITHDLGVVAQYADRVNVMYAGRIVERAPTARLFHHAAHPYTRGLLASIPRIGQRQQRLSTIKAVLEDHSDLAMPLPGSADTCTPWLPNSDVNAAASADKRSICSVQLDIDHTITCVTNQRSH